MKAWEATMRKTQAVARKRANSLFGTIYVGHTEEEHKSNNNHSNNSSSNNDSEDDASEQIYHAEKVLPNGEYYNGQWVDNFPHGQGKYIWTDGCVYVGEWCKGKTMGKGKFSWPSGANYDGEFKNGYMDGTGTYTGSNGETYKGQWSMNLKHGHGVNNLENEDRYEGEWRRGLMDGQGMYQWKNGNYYVGEWRNGCIWGKGSFIWSNGNRFDGFWEDGVPKGSGTFKWVDGSFYVGIWSSDPEEQGGSYYDQSEDQGHNLEWDPREVYNELCEYKVCVGEKVAVMPSQKKLSVWMSSKVSDSKPRRKSVDGRVSVALEKPSDRMLLLDGTEGDFSGNVERAPTLRRNGDEPLKIPRRSKRQGETISKDHKNYELMLNLQLGIRHSVGRPAPSASLDLKPSAFDPKEKVWTRFPPEGSKYTPPHPSCEFKWKDYCPVVFRSLRKLFKVDPADYMLSICGNDALRELSSPGKSGSFFYLTNDDRYMIKTMKKSEAKVLMKMLPAYYNHVRAFENSLVTRFFGLHCVRLTGPTGPIQKKVRFIIMGNLFCSEYSIHRRFDLKGSSLGRTTDKPESEIYDTTILKDLDLNFIFKLQKNWYQEFCRQIDRDCELLEQEGIMDYSLLVGIHFRDISETGLLIPSRTPSANDNEGNPRLSRADMDQLLLDPSKWSNIRLGINMPARVERTVKHSNSEMLLIGEPIEEYYEVVLFFGIIDILQDYDISKKVEHAYKSFQYDPTSISAVDPRQYSRRFRDFIFRIFSEDS